MKTIKKFEIKKSKMAEIKGGTMDTSTTEWTQTGAWENEQELDSDGNPIGDPKLIDMPV